MSRSRRSTTALSPFCRRRCATRWERGGRWGCRRPSAGEPWISPRLWRCVYAEMRTKEAINASFAFALVVLLILSFAFEPTEDTTREISGGLLWIVFLFAGTLILNRSFARELPNDCLDALIAAPVPGAALFLGKGLANFALIFAVEIVALPVFGIFFKGRCAQQFCALML